MLCYLLGGEDIYTTVAEGVAYSYAVRCWVGKASCKNKATIMDDDDDTDLLKLLFALGHPQTELIFFV